MPFVPQRPGSGDQISTSGSSPLSAASVLRHTADPPPASQPQLHREQRFRRGRRRRSGQFTVRRRPPRVRRRLKSGGLIRWARRVRIPLALFLGACAAGSGLLAAERSGPETTSALRVTSDLAAGEQLTAEHLEETDTDVQAVPADHAGQVDDFIGHTIATALPAGALLHPSQLVGPGLLESQPEGTVAAAVRPADTALLGLLSPGQRVDVTVSSDSPEEDDAAKRVAEAAPVLWIPQEEGEDWLGAAEDSQDVVILAVEADIADALAEAAHSGTLHLSLVSGGSGEEE